MLTRLHVDIASKSEVKSDFTIFWVIVSSVKEMSFDLEKSSKFLLLFVNFFFHGVENVAAKGTMMDIDGQFSNELQIHN